MPGNGECIPRRKLFQKQTSFFQLAAVLKWSLACKASALIIVFGSRINECNIWRVEQFAFLNNVAVNTHKATTTPPVATRNQKRILRLARETMLPIVYVPHSIIADVR